MSYLSASAEGPLPDVRMAGVDYAQIRLIPPCFVRVPLSDDWRLYLIRGGEAVFEANDAACTRQSLPAGSVVATSGVLQHRFASATPGATTLTELAWAEERLGDAAPGELIVSFGRICKNRMAFLALFEPIIFIRSDTHPDFTGRIARAMDWITEETARPGRTASAVIQRLSEIIALEVSRFGALTGGNKQKSARQAATDHRILRAISAFYASPEEKWSLERLAEIAGMSRTGFAIRYRELIGTTPLKSLRQLRMQLAAEQLSQSAGRGRLDAAARRVGYQSDSTFIRAFAGEFGVTPGQIARRARR